MGMVGWEKLAVSLALLLGLAAAGHPKMPGSYWVRANAYDNFEGTSFSVDIGVDLENRRWVKKRLTANGGDVLIETDGTIYVMISANGTEPFNKWNCWAYNKTLPPPTLGPNPTYTLVGKSMVGGQAVDHWKFTLRDEGHIGQVLMLSNIFLDSSGTESRFMGMSQTPTGPTYTVFESTTTPPPETEFKIPPACMKAQQLPDALAEGLDNGLGAPSSNLHEMIADVNTHNSEQQKHGYKRRVTSWSAAPKPPPMALNTPTLWQEAEAFAPLYRPDEHPSRPASVDRVAEGLVTSIRNQGDCGGCWAFSVAAAVEVSVAVKRGSAVPHFSVQQLLDCVMGCEGFNSTICQTPTRGCFGGWTPVIFRWLKQHGGLALDRSYQFLSAGGQCQYSNPNQIPLDFVRVPAKNEEAMAAALAEHGALQVAVSATMAWRQYLGGIFDDPHCGEDLDHAVTIVGYGTDEETGKDYWLIKNSWSNRWGMDGYMKMVRGKNMCGIANFAFAPVVGTLPSNFLSEEL